MLPNPRLVMGDTLALFMFSNPAVEILNVYEHSPVGPNGRDLAARHHVLNRVFAAADVDCGLVNREQPGRTAPTLPPDGLTSSALPASTAFRCSIKCAVRRNVPFLPVLQF